MYYKNEFSEPVVDSVFKDSILTLVTLKDPQLIELEKLIDNVKRELILLKFPTEKINLIPIEGFDPKQSIKVE